MQSHKTFFNFRHSIKNKTKVSTVQFRFDLFVLFFMHAEYSVLINSFGQSPTVYSNFSDVFKIPQNILLSVQTAGRNFFHSLRKFYSHSAVNSHIGFIQGTTKYISCIKIGSIKQEI